MIFVLQNSLPHYRRELFNKLAELDELVVIHSGQPGTCHGDKFREILIPSIKCGPFVWQIKLPKLIKLMKPSTIIASADVRNISSIYHMIRFDKKVNWIWWGLDKGKSDLAFYFKLLLCKRKNPIVFYHDEIKRKFLENGVSPDFCYVANNTFHVESNRSLANEISRNSFINVGSLDLRKENDVLIKAFKEVLNRCGLDLYLYFIGEGDDRYRLEKLVTKLELTEHVYFKGRITDTAELEKYYARALASVSFGQAGLSVLQSMGYGVPFITTVDAISGGEKFNIIDGYNGVNCNHDVTSLVNVMTKLSEDPLYANLLRENAYAYYRNKATLEIMVNGFRSAIGHVKI